METPLLAPKPLSEFSPSEYREYVRSFYKAPEKTAEVLFKWTKKGNPQVTVRRHPKWISELEFRELCKMHGLRQNELFIYLKDRKVEVRKPQVKGNKNV